MRFQSPEILALVLAPALGLAVPYFEVDIKTSLNPQSQAPFRSQIDNACQPKDALCMESPFLLLCCDDLACGSNNKCTPADEVFVRPTSGKEVKMQDDDMHAMCRTEGEFCQLIPIPLPCCGNMRCTTIVGGKCEKF